MKILWKWESDNVENMPKNVLARTWLPQNDILAHPNVKLFISHGGIFGSQEALHHGVPMLGIPFYTDQRVNIYRAQTLGFAIHVDFQNVTVESLRWAIFELLDNPSYTRKAFEYSRVFRERPLSAMDTAIFWIEYVIKFRGAPHLKSSGLDLPWYSYLLLDVIAVVILVISVVIIVVWLIVRRLSVIIRTYFTSRLEAFYKKYE